jgi:transposase
MAHAPEVRTAVRRSYVGERQPLEVAAEKHGVSYNTARNWKRTAKEQGDDWDRARSASRMASGGLGDLTTQVLEEFALLFQVTMDEIGNGEYDGLQKAEAMSRLADAYTKTMKAAGGGDSKLAKLAMAMEMLELLVGFVQQHYPQHGTALLEVLEPFGEKLNATYG